MGPEAIAAYLASVDPARRADLERVRAAVNAGLPAGYAEGVQHGMLAWYVPHALYPAGYHVDPRQPVPFASLAAQKRHLSLYLFCVYADPELAEWFAAEWRASGHRLDMGKSCVRFRSADAAPLELIGEVVRRVPLEAFLARYEAALPAPRKRARARPRE